MNISNKEYFTFDDVLLKPKEGIVRTRKEIDLNTNLTKGLSLKIPIVAAPMSSVTNARTAKVMAELGASAFLHRNQTPQEQLNEWWEVDNINIGCAIGLEYYVNMYNLEKKDKAWNRFVTLYEGGCRLFCFDIAHAHNKHALEYITILNKKYPDIELIMGNVVSADAIKRFWHLDIVTAFRVGIGPGAVCTTREMTGHGVPQLTAIAECVEAAQGVPVIADGGINTSGDIVKALAAGASTVMLGRLLAGAEEAPQTGQYYGMASKRAKLETGLGHGFTEGAEGNIEIDGPLSNIIENLCHGIKSGISYSGGKNIEELQKNHEFIRVSYGTEKENKVRI